MSTVEILGVDRWKKKITIRKPPNSMREIMDALIDYWKENEMDYPISEVMRFERPQHLFYTVHWIEGARPG